MKKFCDIIETQANGFNIQAEALSAIQKSTSRKIYMDFDFDNKDFNFLKRNITAVINDDCVIYLQTRGGFHVLIELDKILPKYKKTWYNDIIKLEPDIKGDNVIPVVGCTQGEFVPKFIL